MKKSIRLLSFILCVLMLIGTVTLISCGDTENEKGKDTEASAKTENSGDESSEEEESYKLRDLSNGGNLNIDGNNEFTVYQRNQNYINYGGYYIVPEEGKTDVINQSAFERNAIVEQAYDIKLKCIEADNPVDTLSEDYASGLYYYDIMLDMRDFMGGYALSGYFVNLNTLDVDYTTSWWDKNAYEAYTIKDKLYVMPNDVSVSNLAGTGFFYFSKQVLDDYKLTSPYEFVEKNTWTLENFYKLVKSVSGSTIDGALGTYGIVTPGTTYLIISCGIPLVEKDKDGNLVCKVGSDYAEKTQDILSEYKKLVNDNTVCISTEDADEADVAGQSLYLDEYEHVRNLFNEDHFLFFHSNMTGAKDYGEMKKGYGVVMNPKYDTNQESYYHSMDRYAIIWGVPSITGINLDRVAAVMDYWAYVSTGTVMESYFELTLKTKRVSDPTAAGMLDTIKATIRYFPTDIYGSYVSDFISDSYTRSVTSAWKKARRTIQNKLDGIVEDIEEIDD